MTSTEETGSLPPRGGALSAFRHRNYARFWFGALISSTGTWLGNLTVPYVLYQQTHSAIWVGLAAAAQFGPAFVLSPLGGSLADSRDRRLLLLWTQAGMGLVALAMWLQWWAGMHDPLVLIALVTVLGILNGINNPAWQSLVNDLVPRADLYSAVALNSLQFNMARALGPALAGLLLATLGATWSFFGNAVSFVVVVITLIFVRQHPSRVLAGGPARTNFARQWLDALGYIARARAILFAIALCIVAGLFGNPIFTLTVVFAEDVYRTDPIGLGLLTASLGVGAVVFALGSAFVRSGQRQRLGVKTAIALAWLGASLIVMGLMPCLVFGILAAVAVGAAFLMTFASINTAIQLLAPDHLRGRILAFRHMFFSASLALGVVLGGALTELWGVQVTVIVFGAALVAIVALVRWLPGAGFGLLDDVDADDDPSAGSAVYAQTDAPA